MAQLLLLPTALALTHMIHARSTFTLASNLSLGSSFWQTFRAHSLVLIFCELTLWWLMWLASVFGTHQTVYNAATGNVHGPTSLFATQHGTATHPSRYQSILAEFPQLTHPNFTAVKPTHCVNHFIRTNGRLPAICSTPVAQSRKFPAGNQRTTGLENYWIICSCWTSTCVATIATCTCDCANQILSFVCSLLSFWPDDSLEAHGTNVNWIKHFLFANFFFFCLFTKLTLKVFGEAIKQTTKNLHSYFLWFWSLAYVVCVTAKYHRTMMLQTIYKNKMKYSQLIVYIQQYGRQFRKVIYLFTTLLSNEIPIAQTM